MKNNVLFKFKNGLLFIKMDFKITIINFMYILKNINSVIKKNKFRFIVFDLRDYKYYNFL